jgi:hypothetical protein
MFCGGNSPPDLSAESQRKHKPGKKIWRYAKSQEPNRLNGAILNGVGELVAFRVRSPPALKLLESYYGFDPEEVSNLQPLQFVARNLDSGGELRGRIKV